MAVITTSSSCLASSLSFRIPFVSMTIPSPSAAAGAAAARRTRLLNGVAGSSSSPSSASLKPIRSKRLLLLRHGQAAHNPRAEVARESGCSFEDFLRLMEEDDEYDAALTRLGEDQATEAGGRGHVRRALRDVEMIASSPLSRALRTADLIFPHRAPPHPTSSESQLSPSPSEGANGMPRRVCVEEFREINGRLLNAKRRPRFELERNFPHWDFSLIPPHDETWTAHEYEPSDKCGERGYRGLLWLLDQRERRILVACHGGLLSYTMNDNPRVVLVDGKETDDEGEGTRSKAKRFGNCEMREFVMTVWASDDRNDVTDGDNESLHLRNFGEGFQPMITLEEVTIEESTAFPSNDGGDSLG